MDNIRQFGVRTLDALRLTILFMKIKVFLTKLCSGQKVSPEPPKLVRSISKSRESLYSLRSMNLNSGQRTPSFYFSKAKHLTHNPPSIYEIASKYNEKYPGRPKPVSEPPTPFRVQNKPFLVHQFSTFFTDYDNVLYKEDMLDMLDMLKPCVFRFADIDIEKQAESVPAHLKPVVDRRLPLLSMVQELADDELTSGNSKRSSTVSSTSPDALPGASTPPESMSIQERRTLARSISLTTHNRVNQELLATVYSFRKKVKPKLTLELSNSIEQDTVFINDNNVLRRSAQNSLWGLLKNHSR